MKVQGARRSRLQAFMVLGAMAVMWGPFALAAVAEPPSQPDRRELSPRRAIEQRFNEKVAPQIAKAAAEPEVAAQVAIVIGCWTDLGESEGWRRDIFAQDFVREIARRLPPASAVEVLVGLYRLPDAPKKQLVLDAISVLDKRVLLTDEQRYRLIAILLDSEDYGDRVRGLGFLRRNAVQAAESRLLEFLAIEGDGSEDLMQRLLALQALEHLRGEPQPEFRGVLIEAVERSQSIGASERANLMVGLGFRERACALYIDGLEGEDLGGRYMAIEWLRIASGGQTFGFHPKGSEAERAAAVAKWRAWYAERMQNSPSPSSRPAGAPGGP